MGERFVAVAKVLSGRLCQQRLSGSDEPIKNSSGRTELLEAALSERVKDAVRVLETMEDFGKRVCF